MLSQELVPQDLAGLATPCHGIDIKLSKRLLLLPWPVVAICEDSVVVFEHQLEEVVLDVLPP